MSDLWKEFIDYLGGLEGLDKRRGDLRLLDAALHATAKEFSRRHHHQNPAAAGVGSRHDENDDAMAGNNNNNNNRQLSEHRSEAFHTYMIEATVAHISTMPHVVRAVRAELRSRVNAILYPPTSTVTAGGNESTAHGRRSPSSTQSDDDHSETKETAITVVDRRGGTEEGSGVTSHDAPPQEGLTSILLPLLQLPDEGLAAHVSLSPLEVNVEPLIQSMGPYVRHPEGKRTLSGSGVLKHFSAIDLCNRFLQWSNQRLENVHSGVGSVLASVGSVHRRRLVFLISAEHARAWNDAENHTDPEKPRYAWKFLKESTSASVVQRERPSSSSGSAAPGSGWTTTGDDGDDTARYIAVKVSESDCMRVASGMDHHAAMQLLSTVKASLIQWEKQSQAEFERRVSRIVEQQKSQQQQQQERGEAVTATENGGAHPLDTLTPTADPPFDLATAQQAAAAQIQPAAHFMQVLVLVDVDSHHVGDQLMTTIQDIVLPRLRQTRQSAKASRERTPYRAVFDLFPQVVFFGQRLLQLVLPRIVSQPRLSSHLPILGGAAGEDFNRSVTSLAKRISNVADRVQGCARSFGTMVSYAIPSDSLFPRTLDGDLVPHYATSEIIVSFQRYAGHNRRQPEEDEQREGKSVKKQQRRPVSLVLHYPGGERSATKHAVHLLFQLWCTQSSVGGSSPSPSRQSIVSQYVAFVRAHRALTERLCVMALVSSKQLVAFAVHKNGGEEEPSAFQGPARTEASVPNAPSSSAVISLSYADVLNVVMKAKLLFPPEASSAGSTAPSVELARRVVGQSTILTLVASLYASFGINTVVYDQHDDDEDFMGSDPRRASSVANGVLAVSTTFGFSLMQDVHDYGKQFVAEQWLMVLLRQIYSLEQSFWPLLIELRCCAVLAIRRASMDGGLPTAATVASAAAAPLSNLQRELFVVAVGDDEDAEALERADKSGELGHALCLPICRVFLVPTPYLLSATTTTKRALKKQQQQRQQQQDDDSLSEAASSVSNNRNHAAVSRTHPHDAQEGDRQPPPLLSDDAPFLNPHVYQPEDAEALGRIAIQFSTDLERARCARASASADAAGVTTTLEQRFFATLSVRMCHAAVLHPGRLRAPSCDESELSSDGVGPLLPCVEIGLHYSSGPHFTVNDAELDAIRHSLASDVPGLLQNWVMSAAAQTLDTSVDIACAKEEALVHAIQAAEQLLHGESAPKLRRGGVLPVVHSRQRRTDGEHSAFEGEGDSSSSEEDADNEHEGGGGGATDETTASNSSSWWWWGSSAAAPPTPDVTGLRFSIQSVRLEQKRSS